MYYVGIRYVTLFKYSHLIVTFKQCKPSKMMIFCFNNKPTLLIAEIIALNHLQR